MSSLLASMVATATSESVSRERSMVSSEPRCRSSVFRPGERSVRTVATSSSRVARVAESRLTASRASVMSPRWSSRSVTRVLTRFSTERTSPSRPPSASLSSRVMVLSWLTPPPLSSRDSAPNTSSTSVLRLVRETGMTSPSASLPVPVSRAGATSWMYFSPSRLDCSSRAVASAGSRTAPLISMVTRADQPSSSMPVTRPTATSLTFTAACGTRLRTSRSSAVTVYGWSPRSAPPGSGRSWMPSKRGGPTVTAPRARVKPRPSASSPPTVRPATPPVVSALRRRAAAVEPAVRVRRFTAPPSPRPRSRPSRAAAAAGPRC
ncbi:hypothetical protein SGLAM104S_00228 [Streptomyces glaucescens]